MVKGMVLGRSRRLTRLAVACALATSLALVAGCGGESESDTPARTVVQIQQVRRDRWTYARARFTEMCAGCHTLADARAHGRRFNLDVTGLDESRARYAIAKGEPGMPPWEHVLSKREFEELVAYISTVAHRDGGDDFWTWQMRLRMEGENWPRRETKDETKDAR